MTSKEIEIKAIRELAALDGYFKDEFGNCIKQMEQNILNDFHLLMNTGFYTEREYNIVSDGCEKFRKILKQKDELITVLLEKLLLASELTGNTEFEEPCLKELGRDQVIAFKHRLGIELSKYEMEYLLSKLDCRKTRKSSVVVEEQTEAA